MRLSSALLGKKGSGKKEATHLLVASGNILNVYRIMWLI